MVWAILSSFFVIEITCSARGISEVEIDCDGIGSGASVQCSFNQGPQHQCNSLTGSTPP